MTLTDRLGELITKWDNEAKEIANNLPLTHAKLDKAITLVQCSEELTECLGIHIEEGITRLHLELQSLKEEDEEEKR